MPFLSFILLCFVSFCSRGPSDNLSFLRDRRACYLLSANFLSFRLLVFLILSFIFLCFAFFLSFSRGPSDNLSFSRDCRAFYLPICLSFRLLVFLTLRLLPFNCLFLSSCRLVFCLQEDRVTILHSRGIVPIAFSLPSDNVANCPHGQWTVWL